MRQKKDFAERVRNLVKKIPGVRSLARAFYFIFTRPDRRFSGSEEYWKERYRSGGNSGAGSYRKLAEFKAGVLNSFVKAKGVETVIEYGCGDGNQLELAEYPSYTGFDVSPEAVSRCRERFPDDKTKTFQLMKEYRNETAELTLSLDVIFHLTEDEVFSVYMRRLFGSSKRFVIIYSSNTDQQEKFQAPHVKHRKFSEWIAQNEPGWKLLQHIPNQYPYKGDENEGSAADFYIYGKTDRF